MFSNTTLNALTSTKTTKKKKKILTSLVLKKFILFLFLSLLVNDCILICLETMILCIYNFLILYGCLFRVFFFFFPPLYSSLCQLKILGLLLAISILQQRFLKTLLQVFSLSNHEDMLKYSHVSKGLQ